MSRTFTRRIAAVAAIAGLSIAGGVASASASSAPPDSGAMTADSGAMEMAGPSGPLCAAVPADGEGSVNGMADDAVGTAASNNPLLTTLVAAVTAANLGDTLNGPGPFTVFAPVNSAFAKIPKADLDKVLADKAMLTKVLTYHVVPGELAPDQLAGTHKTLEGADLTVAGTGMDFTANGDSKVVCGNVQTANATVYIVDTVLMPTS